MVIGAGISGLACAFKLKESQAFKDGLLEITVLESQSRAGGIVETIFHNDCLLESGPDSFITNKPYMVKLAERLGIANRLVGTRESRRGAMVVSGGKLVKLPEGFNLMAPSKVIPFLESPIMSWQGKMRVLAEPFLPVRYKKDDESVADFVRRRFGPELLAKIVQPMIGGIYVGDVEKLSVNMAAARFVALEQNEGSVISALMREADANTAGGAEGGAQGGAQGGVRYGLFCSFDRGMSLLIDTLLQKLEGVDIRLSTSVTSISRPLADNGASAASGDNGKNSDKNGSRGGQPGRWRILCGGAAISADHLVLAVPAKIAANLLGTSAPAVAAQLRQIEAASSVVVNFVLDKTDISADIDAFGVVVPAVEMKKHGLNVIALSFASHKFKDRAPHGKLVLRAFLGGVNQASMLDKTDDELSSLALADMRKLLRYQRTAKPQYVRVCRWPGSMPQFQVGHLDLLDKIELARAGIPALYLAGASYRGVGLPECVHSGEVCAEKILEAFSGSHLVV